MYMDSTRVGAPAVASAYFSSVFHTCHMAYQMYFFVAAVAAGTRDLNLFVAYLIAYWYQCPSAAISVYLWRNTATSS